ncbi:MAG: hypothetical protein AAB426_06115 [Myxococcota bacterium]
MPLKTPPVYTTSTGAPLPLRDNGEVERTRPAPFAAPQEPSSSSEFDWFSSGPLAPIITPDGEMRGAVVTQPFVRPPPFGEPGLKVPASVQLQHARATEWLGQLRNAWSDAARASQKAPPKVELGGAELRAVPGPELRRNVGRLTAQKAFEERRRAEGKATLWVNVDGRLEGLTSPGTNRDGKFIGWAKGHPVTFTLQAPFAFDPREPARKGPAEDLVRTLQKPPLSREGLLALPEGAVLELRGGGFVGTQGRRLDGDKPEQPEHEFVVRVFRLDGQKVRVVTEWQRSRRKYPWDKEQLLKTVPAKVSGGGADIKVEYHLGPMRTEAYIVDLGNERGAKAEQALVALDIDTIRAASAHDGVTRDSTVSRTDSSYELGVTTPAGILNGATDHFGWGLGVQLWNNEVSQKDARILGDSLRYAYSQAGAEQGTRIHWLESGGLAEPRLSAMAGVAEGLPANVQAGLETGAVLRYNILSAYDHGASRSALDALTRMLSVAVRDPVRLDDDRIPPGTEIALQRLVMAREVVRYGAGYDREFGYGFEVAATVGAEVSHEDVYDKVIVLKKLDDGRILATVRAATQKTDRGMGKGGGMPVSVRAMLGFNANTIEAAREYDVAEDSSLSKYFEGRLGGELSKILDRTLEHMLSSRFESADRAAKRVERSQQFVFDLKSPVDRDLLRSLTTLYSRGDKEKRAELATGLGERRRLAYEEESEDAGRKTELETFGKVQYGNDGAHVERRGDLKTADGRYEFKQQDAQHVHTFFGKTVKAKWEAYNVDTNLPGEKNAFRFHARVEDEDPVTTQDEVATFRRLVTIAGAKYLAENDPKYPKVESARFMDELSTGWLMRLMYDLVHLPIPGAKHHGKTTQTVDITIERKGVELVAETDAAAAHGVFMAVSGTFDPTAANPPWLAAPGRDAQALNLQTADARVWTEDERVRARTLVGGWLGMQGRRDWDDESRNRELGGLESEYRSAFGRSLEIDALHYAHAQGMVKAITKLKAALARNGGGVDEALKTMSQIGDGVWGDDSQRDVFFWRYLGTLLVLARPENVVLSELSMVGKHVDARAQSEGRLEHPQEVVPRYFDDNILPRGGEALPTPVGGPKIPMHVPDPLGSLDTVPLRTDWNADAEWQPAVQAASDYARSRGFGVVLPGTGRKLVSSAPDQTSMLALGFVNAGYRIEVSMVDRSGNAVPLGGLVLVDNVFAQQPKLKSRDRIERELRYLIDRYATNQPSSEPVGGALAPVNK